MGLERFTTPYVHNDGSSGQPFTRELELASIYVIGDSRRKTGSLKAVVLAEYPILVKKYLGDSIIIDLLGLHKTSLRYNQVPNIENFIKKLDKTCIEPKKFLRVLQEHSQHFKDFLGQENITFNGLVSQPPLPSEINELVELSKEQNIESKPIIFNSILKNKDIKQLLDSLNEFKLKIDKDEKTLEKAKKSLQEFLEISRKVLTEETFNIKDSYTKVQDKLKNAQDKKRIQLKKKLDRDILKIRSSYQKQTRPLREERTKQKRKVTRTENRLDRIKSKEDQKEINSEKRVLEAYKKRFAELDRAVKNLETRRDADIKALRKQFNFQVKSEKEIIEEQKSQTKDQIEEIQTLESEILSNAKNILNHIDSLNRKKRNKRKSLDKYKIELDLGDIEINIPFYIFDYGKKFDYYPPVNVVGSPSLFSRFRRMLADGLESKVNMLIKPRENFANPFFERAIRNLEKDNPLSHIYRQEEGKLNYFKSRKAIDQLMVGLMKLRQGGWINDNEYIRLQEVIIEQIDYISLP